MKEKKPILEHEILKTIFIKTSFQQTGVPMPNGLVIPIYKRNLKLSFLHFGVLVDALNNPEKFPETSLQGLKKATDTIAVSKYEWLDIAGAIDLLESNGHIEDDITIDKYEQPVDRKIRITKEGCIAYRTQYYINQREQSGLDRRQTKSVITTNRLTWWNVGATILFGIIVTTIQIKTCNRDKLRDHREERKLNSDSLIQLQLLRHDSLFENMALRLNLDTSNPSPTVLVDSIK